MWLGSHFDASMVEVGDDDDIDEADEYYDEYVSL